MSPKTTLQSNVSLDLGLPVPRGMFRTPNPSPAPSPEASHNATPMANHSPLQTECSPLQQLTPVDKTTTFNMPAIKVCDADEEADFYQVLQTKMTEILENNTEDVTANEISLCTMQTSEEMDDSFVVDENALEEGEVDPVDVKQQIELWEDRLTKIATRCQVEKEQMEKLQLEKLMMEKKRLEQKPKTDFSNSSEEMIMPLVHPSLQSQNTSVMNNNYDDLSDKDHVTYNSEISIDTLDGIPSLREDVQNFNDVVSSFDDKKVPDMQRSSMFSSSVYEYKSNKSEGENCRRSLSLSFDKDSLLKEAANKLVIYFKNSSRSESPSKSMSPSSSMGSEQITYNQHQVNVT